MEFKIVLRNKILIILYGIKVSEKTLKFYNIEVNKKQIYKSKKPIDLKFKCKSNSNI